mgnify:CR=1 FL=1
MWAGFAVFVVVAIAIDLLVMERQGAPGVKFDVEGSGYGFKVVRQIKAEQARLPSTCKMVRPL